MNNDNQHIQIFSDNKKLIKNLKHFSRYNMTVNDHIRPDFDIIFEILAVSNSIRNKGRRISFLYVKGHKNMTESGKKKVTLSHEEQMHRIAHNLAQRAKRLTDIAYIPLPHNNVNLTINDHHVNANVNKTVKKCYHSIHARQFLQQKYDWSDDIIDNIWWNVHAKSIKQVSFYDRIRIQKFIHNHVNTNHREHKYYSYKPDACKICKCSTETEDHILQCRTHHHREIRKDWIKEIKDLDTTMIPSDVRQAIVLGVSS